jgi:VanZ family protein
MPSETNRKKMFYYWSPAILWASMIFVLSSLSFPPSPDLFPAQDKAVHAVIFGLLAGFIFMGFKCERQYDSKKALMWALVLTSLYGVFDEFHQSFIPNRQVDALDWAADTFGAIVFVVGAVWLQARSRRRKPVASSA